MRILIIEDDLLTATNLCEGLEGKGYDQVVCVQNVADARKLFKSSKPDLLLIDINLNHDQVDGIKLALDFNIERRVPIIYITGEISPLVIRNAIETRPANYLIKPIDLNELTANIELAMINFFKDKSPINVSTEKGRRLSVDTIFQKDNALFVKNRSRFEKQLIEDILWVQADNIYVDIHLSDTKKTLSMPLWRFEEQVQVPELVRVNRSQLINTNHIDSFDPHRAFIGTNEFKITEKFRSGFFNSLT